MSTNIQIVEKLLQNLSDQSLAEVIDFIGYLKLKEKRFKLTEWDRNLDVLNMSEEEAAKVMESAANPDYVTIEEAERILGLK